MIKILSLSERTSSLDTPVADQERSLVDTVADHGKLGPQGSVETDDLSAVLVGWLEQLPLKQKEVLIRRFGLLNHQEATLEQIGLEIGLTRERVRQIQVDGLRRLRDILRQHNLESADLFEDLMNH